MHKKISLSLVAVLLMPLFFSVVIKLDHLISKTDRLLIAKIDRPLNGDYESPKRPDITLANILDGSFQSGFEQYFNFKLRGRAIMTRIANQIAYSLFRSTNSYKGQILVGKDGYLFERTYLEAYLNEPSEAEKHNLYEKMAGLASLQKAVEEAGKRLFVIVTPSKASIYPEYLPGDYHKYAAMKGSEGGYSQNFYEYFVSRAQDVNLKYFDRHEKFFNLKNSVEKEGMGGGVFSQRAVHIGSDRRHLNILPIL